MKDKDFSTLIDRFNGQFQVELDPGVDGAGDIKYCNEYQSTLSAVMDWLDTKGEKVTDKAILYAVADPDERYGFRDVS